MFRKSGVERLHQQVQHYCYMITEPDKHNTHQAAASPSPRGYFQNVIFGGEIDEK